MPVTLDTARDLLLNAVINGDSDEFSNTRLDDAIKSACEHFLRNVPCSRETASITIASGASTVDITNTVTDFSEPMWWDAYISGDRIEKIPIRTMERKRSGVIQSGKPTAAAVYTDSDVRFDKQADQEYSMTLIYVNTLEDFASGHASPATVTLNIPDQYVRDVIMLGASGYLLEGLPNHPEYAIRTQRYEAMVAQARMYYAPPTAMSRDVSNRP